MMDVQTLENWLWEAACVIRGPVDAPKFKDYILPLIFLKLKRLSDVFDDEVNHLAQDLGQVQTVLSLLDEERRAGRVSLVRFFIPENARWQTIRQQTAGLGQYLTDAVRGVATDNPPWRV